MPPKDAKLMKNDRNKYETTQQTETYRQQDTKEKRILAPKTKLDLERLEPKFSLNNNYLGMFKKDEGNKDNAGSVSYSHPLDRLGIVENEFCQKCKKDKGFCPHRGVQGSILKDQYQMPITSGAEYGWRQPIDNTSWGYGVKQQFAIFNADFRNPAKKVDDKDIKK